MIYGTPTIQTNGLVLNLDAANTKSYLKSGTIWSDLSRNNNTGSLVNGPTFSSDSGGGIVFDGVDDYCNIPVSSVPTGSEITISFWTKVNTIKVSGIFSAYNSIGDRQLNIHLPWIDNVVYWDCGSVGSTYDRINTATLTIEQRTGWHNWSFTKNATIGTMIIYLDGSNIASGTGKTATIDTISTASHPCAMARFFANSTEYYSGNVSNMLMYNRALTAQEVLQNYNALKSRFNLK